LLLLFKICLLQNWYGLSDEQTEFMINDRLSFQRFLGLDLTSKVPDRNTIWTFKEKLTENYAGFDIFALFVQELTDLGIVTREGSIIDATFVEAPRQRNSRDENKKIKEDGEAPEGWGEKKRSHKDIDATWTKKRNTTYFGYKDHLKVDKESKIITDFFVTTASTHDSQKAADLIDEHDNEAWMDSAYIGEEVEKNIRKKNPGIKLHINERGYRNNPLTEEQKASNREKSKVRARIEHVNGQMTVCGGLFVRRIGIVRNEMEICMKNMAYNISRFAYLTVKKPLLELQGSGVGN
jgi:IS5 family transposase